MFSSLVHTECTGGDVERVTVTIGSWEKYNPRKGIKNPTWFALSNRLLEDPDFIDFDPLEFKALIYIFSQASKKGSATVSIVFAHADRICMIPPDALMRTIEMLNRIGIITYVSHECNTRVQIQDTTLHYKTRQDTTEQDKTSSCTAVEVSTPVPVEIASREIVHFSNDREIIEAIPIKTKQRWAALYPDAEFLQRESLKAFNWYANNPKKCPKNARGWSQALSSWFDRGWRRHVQTIKPEAGSAIDWAKVFGESGGAA